MAKKEAVSLISCDVGNALGALPLDSPTREACSRLDNSNAGVQPMEKLFSQ